jgi:thymidylate kinase
MLIVVEGIDGSGKNTVADGVAKEINALRLDFPLEEGSPAGYAARMYLQNKWYASHEECDEPVNEQEWLFSKHGALNPLLLQSLLTVNKYEQLELLRRHAGVHNPSHLVLACYTPSALVYGGLDGLDRGWLAGIHAGLPPADLNLLVQVSTEVALRRCADRGTPRELYERREILERAYDAYQELWCANGGFKGGCYQWDILDGDLPVDQVTSLALFCVRRLLSDEC